MPKDVRRDLPKKNNGKLNIPMNTRRTWGECTNPEMWSCLLGCGRIWKGAFHSVKKIYSSKGFACQFVSRGCRAPLEVLPPFCVLMTVRNKPYYVAQKLAPCALFRFPSTQVSAVRFRFFQFSATPASAVIKLRPWTVVCSKNHAAFP